MDVAGFLWKRRRVGMRVARGGRGRCARRARRAGRAAGGRPAGLARTGLVLLAWVGLGGLAAGACAEGNEEVAAPSGPSFVLILTDDQSVDTLSHMPKLKQTLFRKGSRFRNAFVPITACCPSRISLLRSQYAHNHDIWLNTGPNGGYEAFRSSGLDTSTLATWFQDAGYRTAILGKYLNGFERGDAMSPGWDEWYVTTQGGYFGIRMDHDGRIEDPDDETYLTDDLRDHALAFIRKAESDGVPYFLFVTPYAPHKPADPARRHRKMFRDHEPQRSPSFDEKDVSDKPEEIRSLPRLDADQKKFIDKLARKRLASLQAVDDLVEAVVSQLEESGAIDRTVVAYASDSGFHLGEHRRFKGKGGPYDEDVRIPLVLRGPGIPAGRAFDELVLSTDLAPTFALWAGFEVPEWTDGRPLQPLLESAEGEAPSWRRAILLEKGKKDASYTAVRTMDRVYVERPGDEIELYDLVQDPHQLDSRHEIFGPDERQRWSDYLDALSGCAAASCRSLEDAGP